MQNVASHRDKFCRWDVDGAYNETWRFAILIQSFDVRKHLVLALDLRFVPVVNRPRKPININDLCLIRIAHSTGNFKLWPNAKFVPHESISSAPRWRTHKYKRKF